MNEILQSPSTLFNFQTYTLRCKSYNGVAAYVKVQSEGKCKIRKMQVYFPGNKECWQRFYLAPAGGKQAGSPVRTENISIS